MDCLLRGFLNVLAINVSAILLYRKIIIYVESYLMMARNAMMLLASKTCVIWFECNLLMGRICEK